MNTARNSRYSNITQLRDFKRLYDIRDILGMRSKKQIVCPLPMHPHHNNTPSFSVFQKEDGQYWKCHGACGLTGDVIDLVGYMKIPGYNRRKRDHVLQAASLLNSSYTICPPTVKKKELLGLPNNLVDGFERTELVYNYAKSRGLTKDTVKLYRLGQFDWSNSTWLTIPNFDGDRLLGVKLRNFYTTDSRNRFRSYPGSVTGLFNSNRVRGSTEPVVVVKAEIPAMLLAQYGLMACAPTGGETTKEGILLWQATLSFSRKRILIGDNDKDPKIRKVIQEATEERAKQLMAVCYYPPDQCKDVDEWVLTDPNAIPTIKEWLK